MFKVVLFLSIMIGAHSLVSAQEQLDNELRESVVKIDVTLTDLYSRTETKPLVITVFRPTGEGRHPLVIFNHGRPATESQFKEMGRQRFHSVSRFFAAQGFVVMVPTRVGYGETRSAFDPEGYGNSCANVQLRAREEAVHRQVMATLEFAKKQDYVDASKWLVAGQSVGGFTSITVANRAPDNLLGAINFSGGYGGDPVNRKGNSCSPHAWDRSLSQAKPNKRIPTLWLYWSNDFYFGAETPKKWFKAFQDPGGSGKFVQFKDIKGDGHSGYSRDLNRWVPEVLAFLKTLPLQLSMQEPPVIPASSNFAQLSDIDKIPFIKEKGRDTYKNFLSKESPKAFALNSEGRYGWSNGHWDSPSRALSFCNKGAKSQCRLYAVDDDVVWLP
jgi:dienelactone hydrolase